MLDEDINNESYRLDKLRDPRVRALMSKTTVTVDPSFAPAPGGATPTRIVATLSDGRRVSRQVDSIPGLGGQAMTRADVERKFRGNVGQRWPSKHTDEVLRALWDLEQTGDAGSLLHQLVL
jgi:2-methylcitrate dehydratase